jgi:MoaA/NifB/PqqE/SkfB family radical SAM enzyme/membrane protein YqaA with SNARE-associated domain
MPGHTDEIVTSPDYSEPIFTKEGNRNLSPVEDSIIDRMTVRTWLFGAAMIVLGVLGVWMMTTKPREVPYLTVFFYSIPSNMGISFFPHEPVIFWYARFLNLLSLSAVAAAGTLVAAFLDYRFFSKVLNLQYSTKYKSTNLYRRSYYWFYKMPFISLVVAGFTPIPFYPFKFMAYASKYPLRKYLLAVAVGRFPKYYLLALAGQAFQVPGWMIIASFLGMFALVYSRKIFGWLSSFCRMIGRLLRGKPLREGVKIPRSIPAMVAIHVAMRSFLYLFLRKPICVALEVTHSCTANCHHCDKGGMVSDNMVSPDEFKRVIDAIKPPFIQIAGGEPLLREDLPEIVRKLHRPGRCPLLVVITNASLLTREKYRELRSAGVKQFSISLDFPDARHDGNRSIPGLFEHLNRLIPELVAEGNGDITVNCCITRDNYKHIKEMVALCRDWKAKMNFSVYTELRTHNKDLNLRHPEDTEVLNRLVGELYADSELSAWILTSERVLRSYCRFFENGMKQPNCQAGYRFLVVNPDGQLTPCAMLIKTRYRTLTELVNRFSKNNTCDGCYISTRGSTEKSIGQLITDNLKVLRISNRAMREGAE